MVNEEPSKTEKRYMSPDFTIRKQQITLEDVPIEVLRGFLFVFEGRLNWKKDKGEMRRELRRYLKYETNITKMIDTIKEIVNCP